MRPNGNQVNDASGTPAEPGDVDGALALAPPRRAQPRRRRGLGGDPGVQRRGDPQGVPHAAPRVALPRLRDDRSSMTAAPISRRRLRQTSRCGSCRRRAGSGRRPRATSGPAWRPASSCSSSTPTSWYGPTRWASWPESFEAGDVDGLCGVQAAQMRYTNIASQYKNLWMRWTYLRQTGDVPLFYTTAAAIRREAFLRVGGFDQGYATPNVEDTALRPEARAARRARARASRPRGRAREAVLARQHAAHRLHAGRVAHAAEAPPPRRSRDRTTPRCRRATWRACRSPASPSWSCCSGCVFGLPALTRSRGRGRGRRHGAQLGVPDGDPAQRRLGADARRRAGALARAARGRRRNGRRPR